MNVCREYAAVVYFMQGRFDEGEQLFVKVMETAWRVLGEGLLSVGRSGRESLFFPLKNAIIKT